MAYFGIGLIRVRKELGVSQEALAERTGIQRSHISRIESGRITMPSRPVVERLAAGLGVTADDLYRAAGVKSTVMAREENADYDATEIAVALARWPKAQRAALWQYIEAVSSAMDAISPPDDE